MSIRCGVGMKRVKRWSSCWAGFFLKYMSGGAFFTTNFCFLALVSFLWKNRRIVCSINKIRWTNGSIQISCKTKVSCCCWYLFLVGNVWLLLSHIDTPKIWNVNAILSVREFYTETNGTRDTQQARYESITQLKIDCVHTQLPAQPNSIDREANAHTFTWQRTCLIRSLSLSLSHTHREWFLVSANVAFARSTETIESIFSEYTHMYSILYICHSRARPSIRCTFQHTFTHHTKKSIDIYDTFLSCAI